MTTSRTIAKGALAARKAKREARRRKSHWSSLASLYSTDPMERVTLVRDGVPAELLPVIADHMAITKEKLYATIGLARATADRKARLGRRLSPDESERVLGLTRLVGQVERMVRESGDPDEIDGFDAAKWVAAWVDQPLPALGGQRPRALMDTSDGRAIVSGLLAQMQSGAYA